MKKVLQTLAIIVIPISLLAVPFFIKVNVTCKTQFGDCPDEIKSELQNANGKSLRSAKRSGTKILKDNNLVTNFSSQFKLPNQLKFDVIIKKPMFALINSDLSESALVDSAGYVLQVVKKTQLPHVKTSELPPPGSFVSDKELFALKIILGVSSSFGVNFGEMDSDSLVVELPIPIEVIFPLEGDTEVLLGSLRLIYSRIENPSKDGQNVTNGFKQLDLRFKNPVLR